MSYGLGDMQERARLAEMSMTPHASREMPTRRSVLVAALATPFLAGCGDGFRFGDETAPPGTRGRAALLIPLSGASAGLGQVMREAASLGGEGVGLTAEIEILDSGETPESAARAAETAVGAGAKLIVGPLFGRQTAAVVAAAGRGVPVVTLSNDTSLAQSGAWVFGVTPAHSAQAVLGFAASRGKRRVVMVSPDGEFGRRSASVTASLGTALGLEVGDPVFRGSAGGLVDAVRTAGGGALPDAIYMPSAGPELASFAQALSGTGAQLMGSVQWSSLDIGDVPGLRDAWFAAPDPIRFAPFARALETRTDAAAGVLTGLVFDGVEMARLLGRAGQQDRRGLARDDGFDGVLGPFRFTRDRICQRGLGVLQVGAGEVTLIGSTGI